MRKFFGIFLVVVTALSFSVCGFAENLKIGYVDTIKVFNEYQRTKDQDQQLEEKKELIQGKLDAKEKEIQKIQSRLEVLKEDQKEKERENLQTKMQEYREMRQKEFTDIKKERDEMMKKIVDDIDQAVSNYGKENKYDFIINGNSVLYGTKTNDLTSDIIKIINKSYK
ncbi:MAG: OmpH family outer membrane protein [Candidatus Omnitrophica bacterium]|nr:OmpH family outer membrane protein [Candidatus Omnitrophota bacterium]MCF7891757.1 OmpH family outer membrane protein [Candidatus Omnitrophota bacterium]MCF7895525.1 OmpH family outer membrane protein [Candidatus Omnitrophota bacterium]MCF7897642.1 OmpH family outer membrane protein [Candidatus Omnitrophota bacterium]MCF7909430.1 OmpH family outer membrane protein [Candidatus Omnitrophota bacterium]